jgi:hypothetical protein
VSRLPGEGSSSGSAASWAVFVLTALLGVAAGALYLAGVFDTPRIDSLAPNPARPGDQVMVKGARFSGQVGGNIVLFGDKAGRILQAAPASLLVEVPDLGATGGGLRVPVRVLVGSRVSMVYDLALGAGSASVASVPSTPPAAPSSRFPVLPPTTLAAPSPTLAATPPTLAGAGSDLGAPPPQIVRAPAPPPSPLASTGAPSKAAAAPSPRRSPSAAAAPAPPVPATGPEVANLLKDAEAASSDGRYEAAVQMYDDVLKREPENPKAKEGKAAAETSAAALKRAFVPAKTESESPDAPKEKKLREFDTGGVSVKRPADVPARLDFEVAPEKVRPGERYTIKVFLANDGKKAIKIGNVTVSTVSNGKRQTGPVPPLRDDIDPRERILIFETSDTWKGDTSSWALETVVTAKSGDTYRNRLNWK